MSKDIKGKCREKHKEIKILEEELIHLLQLNTDVEWTEK